MDFNFDKEIILQDDRVQLRPLAATDIESLLAPATSDADLVRFSPMPIHSKELLTQYIESSLAGKTIRERYPFVIFDKQTNTYAGSTSFLFVSNYHRRLEIGATWLGKKFHRTGLNRHCKFLMLSYCFDELEFERVEFKTDERNTTSRNAIEKIGGQFEGVLRSHTVMNDGFRRNTVNYSILKDEWPALKQRFMQWLKQ